MIFFKTAVYLKFCATASYFSVQGNKFFPGNKKLLRKNEAMFSAAQIKGVFFSQDARDLYIVGVR